MKAVKIVVSSKDLAYQLSHIDFNGGEYVEFADFKILNYQKYTIL